MKTFTVDKGTEGILLIQGENIDIETQDWITRKPMVFTDDQVVVDPFNHTLQKNSLAESFASQGYFIFSTTKNATSQYMLAIKHQSLEIVHD